MSDREVPLLDDAELGSANGHMDAGTGSNSDEGAQREKSDDQGDWFVEDEDHRKEIGKDGFKWSEFRTFIGPSWLISIAYLDPGNLETDLQAGSQFDYTLVWVLLWSSVLGIIVQILSIRLGIVSQRHLAQMCRDEYPRHLSTILWVASEIMIVASDVPEVVGTAFALQILSGGIISLFWGVIIASCSTMIFLLLSYCGRSTLEAFVGCLVAIISFCFVLQCIEGRPDSIRALEGLAVPKVPLGAESIAVGLLGAVVMPHNLYLQSALVQERPVHRTKTCIEYACIYTSLETSIALFVSCLVNMSVLLVASSTFAPHWCPSRLQVCHGGNDVCDGTSPGAKCMDVGLQTASELLERVLGQRASVLWGIALLASGQSSTITGTYAGQFVMEGFVKMSFPLWLRNLISRSLAVLPSLIVVLISGAEGANQLIVYSSVVLALHLPFALVPLLKFTDSSRKMGVLKNSPSFSVLSWCLAGVVCCADAALVYINLIAPSEESSKASPLKAILLILASMAYLSLLGYLIWLPVKNRVPLPADLIPASVMSPRRKSSMEAVAGGALSPSFQRKDSSDGAANMPLSMQAMQEALLRQQGPTHLL